MHNEDGFVLVTCLMILVVLTLLGIAATTNTSLELQIAGNDRVHKETFYSAEAGAILGSELLEQNFNCVIGFSPTGNEAGVPIADIEGQIRVYSRDLDRINPGTLNDMAFWRNLDFTLPNLDPADPGFYMPNINERDAAYPVQNLASGQEVNNLYIAGQTQMLPGGALQMAAGYEGLGHGGASGGIAKIMDIYSEFQGVLNSNSIVLLGWRHLIGSEGDCTY